jgi:hypothetical protein
MATTARPEVTGRAVGADVPLAITVKRTSELSGLGLTSIWAFLRDGRLEAVRVPGVRRTLVSYSSLTRLLTPSSSSAPPPRTRGRPRKASGMEVRP